MGVRTGVCGVGVNDADYRVVIWECVGDKRKAAWKCPFYERWVNMMDRGHSNRYKQKYQTYKDVSVCEEWHTFSTFKAWMGQQPWEGMQLDKDILMPGNIVYKPEACVFVPGRVNNLLIAHGRARGEYPLGVYYKMKSGSMVNELRKPMCAQVSDGSGKLKHLGVFAAPEEAHKAWQLGKADVIEETVEWWRTDDGVKHSFHQGAAEALLHRAYRLREDAANGIETKEL